MNLLWGLHFNLSSFFPKIELNQILEYEFSIGYTIGIPIEFNNKEYYEFVWLYERLVEEKKKEENPTGNGGQNVVSALGVNMAEFYQSKMGQ